ncbi:ATP-dependent zinc metalloprotease FtsH [Candidatus Uhrbacteria bacterium]|nr:ATP-dependent zinc metalloprotease FtsH [Candidatus Uhrbacteria bacterium]
MKPLSKNVIVFLLVILAFGAILSTTRTTQEKPVEASVSEIVASIHASTITKIEVRGTEMIAFASDGRQLKATKESQPSVPELLSTYGVSGDELARLPIEIKQNSGKHYLLSVLLPSLLPLFILLLVFYLMFRQFQGANGRALQFGMSGAKEVSAEDRARVTFADVAGAKEAKEELEEVVDFLKQPKKFTEVGAKIPKGVLLMGAPGTGKTLLARAVAGEADVPFFHISGSSFVEMFVGVGAARVRDLFAKAKKSAPCIVFIDEIDAVGRHRGAGLGGGHDEREQTLNQILVEMDGFETNLGVIVMAATNRPDVLDPALLRPGRFDRRVVIDLPDINDREAILKIHAKNKPLAEGANLRRLAERTVGFSGADLESVLNEAAIATARHDETTISMQRLTDAIEKVLLGPERKSHVLTERERTVTAYHEAGHAFVAHTLPHADPVHKISIISRGRAAGYTMNLPSEDRKMHTRASFLDDMAVFLGGYVSESLHFGDVTTGASDDLKRATALARDLVTRYGMSEALGARTYGSASQEIFLGRDYHEMRDYSDATAEAIDQEILRLVEEAKGRARKIIEENRDKMKIIADELLVKETIEKERFEELVGAKTSMKEEYGARVQT